MAPKRALGQVAALDGVRCIAILLVACFHYFGLAGGTIGVDVFFVLSGFLITTLLLEERARKGRIDLRAFYARRARRLFPALAVMLAVYVVVAAALGQHRMLVAVVAVSYAANIVIASGSLLLNHSHLVLLWSLAQEEQFYLVWPLLLLCVIRSRRAVAWIVVAFLLLSAWRAGLTMDGAPRPRIYQGPDTRSTALLAGAALSVYRHRYGVTVGEWAGKIGLSAVLFGAVFGWSVTWWPIVGQPVLETGVVLLLAAALCDTAIARGLAARPLVWIGRRSYSLYLWHGLVLSATLYVVGRNLLSLTIALGISVLVAQASYRYVEQPFRRRRSSAPVEQRKARERLVPGEPADQPL